MYNDKKLSLLEHKASDYATPKRFGYLTTTNVNFTKYVLTYILCERISAFKPWQRHKKL